MLEAAVLCLALNIYYEARSEPLVGKLVGIVTVNPMNLLTKTHLMKPKL